MGMNERDREEKEREEESERGSIKSVGNEPKDLMKWQGKGRTKREKKRR